MHPGLVEADGPRVLIKRTKLDVLQKAQPLCVHKGCVLENGGLEQSESEGPYTRQESARGDGSGNRGLGKV